jgi:predicted enzyme related to lactoylglutathione lyase
MARIGRDCNENVRHELREKSFASRVPGAYKQRVMITGIEIVTFKVADLDRACDFYEKKLGLKVAYRDDAAKWAEIDGGALHLGLQQAEDAGGGRNPFLSFSAEDLDATVATLRERGVELVGDIVTSDVGRTITVKDPDGNQFELFEPGD